MLQKVWQPLGSIESMMPAIVDSLFQYSQRFKMNGEESEVFRFRFFNLQDNCALLRIAGGGIAFPCVQLGLVKVAWVVGGA